MEEFVRKDVHKEYEKTLDERFSRDKADIERHGEAIETLTKLTAEISQLVKQHDDTIKSHESRIDSLEHKPSVWFDRIVSWFVSAMVAAFAAALIKF